jgi:hypothetical protein
VSSPPSAGLSSMPSPATCCGARGLRVRALRWIRVVDEAEFGRGLELVVPLLIDVVDIVTVRGLRDDCVSAS